MIKKFSWTIVWGLLLLGTMLARAQEAAEGSAVKLGSGAVLKNTIIWGNKGKQLDGPAGSHCYIQAAGLANPKFLDTLHFDFRLSQGSPCWEGGEDLSIFGSDAVDLWGNKRVKGTHIDIGAHEYTTYEIHFIANSKFVKIEEVKHGDSCDSTHVEPNHAYSFKLNTDLIAGIDARDVIVKKLGENKPLDPDGEGFYTLEKVNSDVDIQIILTPPNEVAVELPQNGTLRASDPEKGISIPDGEGEAQKLSMMVAPDKSVVVDTASDEGYYCKEVWMTKKDGTKISVKGQLGAPGIQITESVTFSAEYAPNLYPLKLQINDAEMGKLSVSDGTNTYALPADQTEWTKNGLEYAKNLVFTVTTEANAGYIVKSVKVLYQDGTFVDITSAAEKKASMKVGGLTIAVEFEGKPCWVSWNCTNGDLTVTPGTVESVSGGGKRVAVKYNQEISIVPVGAEGYEEVPNTLTAKPDGGVEQQVTDGKWTVTQNTSLSVQFRKKKYKITVEAEPTALLDFYSVSTGTLPADGEVEHGTALVLTAKTVEGYVCSGVQLDGGALQAGVTSVSLPDIQAPHTVKFVFTRKAYTVAYTNLTPAYGTLKVETKDKDGTTWADLPAVSPGTVYYLDQVKVTATANAHYHLKALTVQEGVGAAVNYTVAGTYTNAGVTDHLTVSTEFEPDKYSVTIEKDQTSPGNEPGQGRIVLKTGTTVWGTMDYTDLSFTPVDIPYGTVVTVEVQTQTNYACTDLKVNGTSIQPGGSFTVSGATVVKALIVQSISKYKITVNVVHPQGSTSNLRVKTAADDQDVVLGDYRYDNNTALKVKKEGMADEICLWVKANGTELSGEDYTISSTDVEFTAKFVKACTIRIVNPPHSVITVTRDGVNCPDGTVVPQGVTLQVKIKAETGTGCVYGCRTITADGNPLWSAGAVNPQALPITEYTYSLALAETSTARSIELGGTDMTFYEVQYTAAGFGSLSVTADDNLIQPGRKYWYPENTVIGITAKETVTGYGFNTDHKVVNHAVTPEAAFVLTPEATAGSYAYTLAGLDRNLDLTALFELKKYPVHLKGELPGSKTLAEVGTVKMSGGDPVLTDFGTAQVAHGGNVVIEAEPKVGYAVRIKAGTEVKVSAVYPGKAVYTSPAVTAEGTYTVSFMSLYQIHYAADIAKVLREDGSVVADGDWAYAGEKLTAYSALPSVTGKECKSVTVAGFTSPTTIYAENTDVLTNGTVECVFDMPEADVQVNAVFDWIKYDLAYTLTPASGMADIQVVRTDGGDVSLSAGSNVLNYGDHLKVVIRLLPVEPGSAESWYEVASCTAVMGTGSVALTPSSSGLERVYVLNTTVKDHVTVTVVVKRRTQHVILQLDPPNLGFSIRLQVDGGGAVDYSDAYREIAVPVGAKVEAWARMTSAAPEGYELTYFPGAGKKEEYITKDMPLHDNLLLAAKFTLKNYPLNLSAVPAEGGSIQVTDSKGAGYNYNGSAVKYRIDHGTGLTSVTAVAADAYFHLDEVTGYMGGNDRFTGQTVPYHIDKVVDSVGIEAHFSKRYRILKENPVANGALEVWEADGLTDADGRFYPEKTLFRLKVIPVDETYACTYAGIYFPGAALTPVTLTPDADGNAVYTVPEGLEAKDITFTAVFEKKKFKVLLKREPAEGGSAEVWMGEKPAGTLLLQLVEGDTDLQTSEAEVAHGSVLYFYTDPNVPAYEVASKVTGARTPYNGPVTVVSDTLFSVRYGRLYTLTFGPNIVVKRTDDGLPLASGVRIPEGTELVVRAELTGHDCTNLAATKEGGAYLTWSDTDADGVIEETFSMPDGDVEIQGTFQTKKFKVKIEHQPNIQAFDVLEVQVIPGSALPPYPVDRTNGSLAEYLSVLHLDLATLQLHPWYEGPVTVTAVMKGDATPYDLQVTDLVVKDSVTVTATAHRKKKQLHVVLQSESGTNGNQVVVQSEDGTQHTFTEAGSLTVEVGAAVEIWTIDGEGCKTILLSADDGVTTPVTNAPFTLNLVNMPDQEVTVTARFQLKRYPVYYMSNSGGYITVNKIFHGVAEGEITHSGDEVKHFTELKIVAEPESQSWQLKPGTLITKMGGVVVEDPAYVASVTASVNIEATFERIYEIRTLAPDPLLGTLEVSRADTNAVGYRYPAGTVVQVKAEPKTGYEIVSLKMNGEMQDFLPQGGVFACTLPGNDPAVDSVEFEIAYALKKYKVNFIVSGQGVMDVTGLPGGAIQVEAGNVVRHLEHFSLLSVSLTPRSEAYRITRFNIHLEDGTLIPVQATDTTLEITGETRIEAEFRKYYWIEYTDPEHGTLAVKEKGMTVVPGDRYPGTTALDVRAFPDEGYEVDYLTANGVDVVNNTVLLPEQDAVYDTVWIDARFKIRKCLLTVVQPDSGFIEVERLNQNGNWEALDVSAPVTLDYWTQIRINADVYNPAGYEVQSVQVNGLPYSIGQVWTMRGDVEVGAVVVPRLYTVTFTEPQFGRLRVETAAGEIRSGDRVPYRTELTVTALPDDPEGYEVIEVKANGKEIGNEGQWTVLQNTDIAALIRIRRWEVNTFVSGEGTLSLYLPDGTTLFTPSDIVDHYTVLKIRALADPEWMLYALEVDGADMGADSTIVVTRVVSVRAEFRKKEVFLFPVAFTPNGDGYNDTWKIAGLWQAPENTLEIFNRDQQSLYKASPYMNEWEGTTDNGNILPAGTYIYKFTTGKGEEYMGLVSIVRN